MHTPRGKRNSIKIITIKKYRSVLPKSCRQCLTDGTYSQSSRIQTTWVAQLLWHCQPQSLSGSKNRTSLLHIATVHGYSMVLISHSHAEVSFAAEAGLLPLTSPSLSWYYTSGYISILAWPQQLKLHLHLELLLPVHNTKS